MHGTSQAFVVLEAGSLRNRRDGKCGVFEQVARCCNAKQFDGFGRRSTGGCPIDPGEIAFTHSCLLSQSVYAQISFQIFPDPGVKRIEPTAGIIDLTEKSGAELSLATGADHIHDQCLCETNGNFSSRVFCHHGKSHIDARGHSCRSPYIPIFYEHAVRLYLHIRMLTGKIVARIPMCYRAMAIQQTTCRENERACANRAYSSGLIGQKNRIFQKFRILRCRSRTPAARNQESMELSVAPSLHGFRADFNPRVHQLNSAFRRHKHDLVVFTSTYFCIGENLHWTGDIQQFGVWKDDNYNNRARFGGK